MAPSACGQDVRGLALFVRRGMAAWMRGVAEPCVRTAPGPAPSDAASAASRNVTRAPGVEQMLVNIVAAMALASTMEVLA